MWRAPSQLLQVEFQIESRRLDALEQLVQMLGDRSQLAQLESHLAQKPSASVKWPVPQLEHVPFSLDGLRLQCEHDVQLVGESEQVGQRDEQL